MSILSEQELVNELGKGILFHPLKSGKDSELKSISDCRLCVTASEYAYSKNLEARLKVESENIEDEPGKKRNFLSIPEKDTVLVWTDESVWLSSNLIGSVHSRVGLVSQGIGHLGTTITPCWSGCLCIALHNVSNKPIKIYIKDVEQPIAYLIISKLSSKSSTKSKDVGARLDLLKDLLNHKEISDWFHNRDNKWMVGDTEALRKLLHNSPDFKTLKKNFSQKAFQRLFAAEMQTFWVAVAPIIVVLSIFSNFVGGIIQNYIFKPLSPSKPPANTSILKTHTDSTQTETSIIPK